MAGVKGNKNAAKKIDELELLIPAYIQHLSEGLSKECFVDCDYRTIEKYLSETIVLQTKKERAERAGRLFWERLMMYVATGKSKGNPAVLIFTMKNKFPESYKDRTEVEQTIINPEEDKKLIAEVERIKKIINNEQES
jgi:hypothetical protein